MAKYYFRHQDAENCYRRDHFVEIMKDEGLAELQVYPAMIMHGSGFFYCQEHGEVGESNTGECGKSCDHYKPRNGKNGRCRHHSNCYEPADEAITIKLTPKQWKY